MIRVGLKYVCLFEYIDNHLGGKVVRAVVSGSGGRPASMVFEDGYCLPILCPCCGRPIDTRAGGVRLADLVGLRLDSLEYHPKIGDHAQEVAYLFAPGAGGKRRPGSLGSDWDPALFLHLDSAREIYRLNSDDLPPAGRPVGGRKPNRKKKR